MVSGLSGTRNNVKFLTVLIKRPRIDFQVNLMYN